MKRVFKIAFPAFLLLGIASCGKYLDELPRTGLPMESIYFSEPGLEAAIVGIYAHTLSSELWAGNMMEWYTCTGGLMTWKGYRTTEDWLQLLDFTQYSANARNTGTFQQFYQVIRNANEIITNLPDSPVDENFKTEIEAEARFWRAVTYFYAVRMWGDLPLMLKTPTTDAERNLPRTSYDKVYVQILEDLTFAERHMRDPDRVLALTGTTGRANKWAATAFKAKVYVQIASILGYPDWQAYKNTNPEFSYSDVVISNARDAWQLAYDTAVDVIENGPYDLEPDFRSLFRFTDPSDYFSKERIVVLQISEAGTSASAGVAVRSLPQRLEGTADRTTNSNYGRIRPSRFFFQKWAEVYGGRRSEPGREDGLTDVYLDCQDPRFNATFIHTSFRRHATTGTSLSTVTIYPSDTKVNRIVQGGDGTAQHPYLRKYFSSRFNTNRGYADFYMLRLSDIYLTAAEAAAELSRVKGDDYWNRALYYVEEIHDRARNSSDNPPAAQPTWAGRNFADHNELITAIVWERMYELFGELHEPYDMKRRGAQFFVDNVVVPLNSFNQQQSEQAPFLPPFETTAGVEYVGNFRSNYHGRTFDTSLPENRKRLLNAFPAYELRINTALTMADQNPYYVQ